MDVEEDVGGHVRQAIIGDDAVWMVVPLAVAGDELERCELEVFETEAFTGVST
ncbi:MAG: hypothetical protein QF415_16825 [Candidatus Undinarchaeales archaeon]|jgi:hypothetical protein|nr:hypothetical protein [Candidatus Undinarchaeales archaeon]MDP7494451.1 hypothetical protein [Candidatus Undinarchaeales archaeon]